MNVFDELERLKKKQISVIVLVNGPTINGGGPDEISPMQVIMGPIEELDKPADEPNDKILIVTPGDGETIEQTLYRSVLDFDDKFPEYL